MVTRHKWAVLGVAVLSFCLGFFSTIYFGKGTGSNHSRLGNYGQSFEQNGVTDIHMEPADQEEYLDMEDGDSEIRLLTEADLVEAVVLDSGQVITTSTLAIPENLAGRTLGEVRSLYPGWRIIGFAPERLTIKIPDTQVEKLYGHMRFLGIAQGRVAIFRGKPNVYQELVRLTQIPVGNLPEFEVKNLQEGLPFEGEDELSILLESFSESQ